MKNYQPDYYNNFKCIADKCSITCCQEWKIAVDDATNRKWKKLSADKVSGNTALKVLEYLKIDPAKTKLALIMNTDSQIGRAHV